MTQPSKVLLVAPFDYYKKNDLGFGNFYYGMAHKLLNGFIRNGCFTYPYSDRDTARSLSLFGTRKLGRKKANEKLFEVCKNIRPDILFLYHADIIEPDIISEILEKKLVGQLAMLYIDPLYHDIAAPKIERFSNIADYCFFTTGGSSIKKFKTEKNRVAFIPNICDSSIDIYKAFEAKKTDHDLIFTATGAAKDPRLVLARDIMGHFPDMDCSYHGFDGKDKLVGYEYMKALGGSRIGLNINRHLDGDASPYLYYASDRMAHYIGNGVLAVTERKFGYNRLFDEDEMLFFDDREELFDKIAYFRQNDAKACVAAEKSWQKYHSHFEVTKVVRFILDVMAGDDNNKLAANYIWGDEVY